MKTEWVHKKLGEIGEIVTGSTPPTNKLEYWNGEYNFYSPADFDDNVYCSKTERTVTKAGINVGRCIPANAIMVACIASIGKIALSEAEGITNQQINTIIPNEEYDYKFLYYLLLQNVMAIKNKAAQTTIPIINKEGFSSLEFSVPSLDTQRHIAAILSSADKVIASTQKVIAKYKQMKQGLMEDLLKPKEGWKMVKLGDVVTVFDGTHQTPYYVENGIPFYSVENVTSNEFEHTKYITEEEHLLLTQKHKIEKGDILMTRIGSIGVCKLVDWDVNASFYVSLALLKMKEGFDAKYLVFYSQTEAFKRSILHESLTFAYPQKINLGDICNVEMFVPYKKNAPDLTEQSRIAAILSGIDAKIASEEKVLEKYEKIKKGMMERMLEEMV